MAMTKIQSILSWKWWLGLFGLLILAASVWYANYLATRLAVIEQNYTEIFARAQEVLNQVDEEGEECDCCDMTLHFEIIQGNTTVPAILVNELTNDPIDGYNFPDSLDADALKKTLVAWQAAGVVPIQSAYSTSIYLGESRMLQQLRLFPIIQFLLIAAFVLFGYFAINAARRAEQNRIWVGMAKETAHQLGTPISAMMGWAEHLRMVYADQPDIVEVADELNKDISRLDMVATRFSKIGADPELVSVNIYGELAKVSDYMSKRAPRKVSFHFPAADAGEEMVKVNPLLFDWVLENLLRNGLDALEGKGRLSGEVIVSSDTIHLHISDTGKGIPANKFQAIFKPGYTTKQRGWGLGLSLAKRIIEQYHKGKIFVKTSEIGKGTTFCISLPRAKQ